MNRLAFARYSGVAAALMVDNIDTDQIIPSREMKTTARDGLADGMFAGWRYLSADGRAPDPAFVLNQEGYEETTILISGENFGCGSSREHAVWALGEYGIRAIIAKSYGDIFYNNCTRNGVLPIRLEPNEVDEIAAQKGPRAITIDLPGQKVLVGNREYEFEIGAYPKRLLLEGVDPIGMTKKELPAIRRFQHMDQSRRPWIYR
jgi:3-isopropylmalate/(R)-2-methylmalate dehydratase small subunit